MTVTQLWTRKLQPGHRSAVAISPDNELAAIFGAGENEISIADLKSGKNLWVHDLAEGHLREVELVFTPDSKQLLFCDPNNKTLLVFDVKYGDLLNTIEHEVGLYSPRFLHQEQDKDSNKAYFFSGKRTFEIVAVELEKGTISPYFDLRRYSKETGIENAFGDVFYHFRDFVVFQERVVVGVGGFAMAFDTTENILQWKTELSEARPVWLNPQSQQNLIAVAAINPQLNEIRVDTGQVLRSGPASGRFIGLLGERVITVSLGVVNFPTMLKLTDWNDTLTFEHELSSTHLQSSVCSLDGKYILTGDALGIVECSKLVAEPTEQDGDPIPVTGNRTKRSTQAALDAGN